MLSRFASNPLHELADMMVLVVLSHGRDGKIITSGGREFPIETVYEQFNNHMCPLLKGKPKFFIIQVICIYYHMFIILSNTWNYSWIRF